MIVILCWEEESELQSLKVTKSQNYKVFLIFRKTAIYQKWKESHGVENKGFINRRDV